MAHGHHRRRNANDTARTHARRGHVAVFAIGAERLPRELPAGQSPYTVTSGQWTTGLVVK